LFLAKYVDAVIMLALGIWVSGVALGWFAVPRGNLPVFVGWFERNARWIGPLLIAIAVVLVIAGT
jgi:hypothetical protein